MNSSRSRHAGRVSSRCHKWIAITSPNSVQSSIGSCDAASTRDKKVACQPDLGARLRRVRKSRQPRNRGQVLIVCRAICEHILYARSSHLPRKSKLAKCRDQRSSPKCVGGGVPPHRRTEGFDIPHSPNLAWSHHIRHVVQMPNIGTRRDYIVIYVARLFHRIYLNGGSCSPFAVQPLIPRRRFALGDTWERGETRPCSDNCYREPLRRRITQVRIASPDRPEMVKIKACFGRIRGMCVNSGICRTCPQGFDVGENTDVHSTSDPLSSRAPALVPASCER